MKNYGEWVKIQRECKYYYEVKSLHVKNKTLGCCDAPGKADYLDVDYCQPGDCPLKKGK